MHTSFSTLLLMTALGAELLVAPPVRAQTQAADTARATQLFKQGKVAFSKGDMEEAERLFAEALSLRKSSDIAANLAQSQLEQRKYRSAAEHFAWALTNLMPSATDAQRKAVETGLAKARAEVAMLRLEITPDGSEVLVGEQALGKSPISAPVYVDPGEVILSVKHDGYVSLDKRVVAAKGTEQAVQLELVPVESAAAPAGATTSTSVDSGLAQPESSQGPLTDRAPRKTLLPAFVATGVAVAGGAFGLGFTLMANAKEADADELRDRLKSEGGCSGGGAPVDDCDQLRSDRESVDSSRNLALGAFIVGGVSAVVAGYFYWDALSSRSGSAQGRRRQLAVVPSIDLRGIEGASSAQSVSLTLLGNF